MTIILVVVKALEEAHSNCDSRNIPELRAPGRSR